MRDLQIDEIKYVHGASWEDFGTAISLIIGSVFAGAAAGHISCSILGYQLASYAGAGTIGATLSGFASGIAGAYAGGSVLIKANTDLYMWAKRTFD